MKKMLILFGTAIVLTVLFTSIAVAQNYGFLELSGIDLSGNDEGEEWYVFYSKDYHQNYNGDQCRQTNWFWPAGTQYAFWLPREGNEDIYMHLMFAFDSGRLVFVNAYPEAIDYGGIDIPCRLKTPGYFLVGD